MYIAKSYSGEQSRVRAPGESASRREEETLYRKFYLPQTDWFTFGSIGSTSQEATPASTDAFPFRLFLLFGGWSRQPDFFLPSTSVPRRNKQLLSTFRPTKWEKAVGEFNLLRVWRVLRGFPRRRCKGVATYRKCRAVATLTLRRRWRKQYDGNVKLWLCPWYRYCNYIDKLMRQ